MKRAKVVHLLETFNPGGMEAVVCRLCGRLRKGKFDAEIWAIAEGGELREYAARAGIKTRVLGLRTYHSAANIFRLASELRRAGPLILHTHGYFCGVFGRLAGLFAGVPVMLAHLHTTLHGLGPLNRLLDRTLNLFSRRVLCVSGAVKRSYLEMGYGDGGKFEVLYNGVEETLCSLSRPAEPAQLLFNAASLFPHKGHRYLIDVCAEVRKRVPEARLRIAGSGPLREELESYCRAAGLEGAVEFLGQRGDVPELLAGATVYVSASTREGFSLACAEAMAAGVPVVAFDSGGLREVVSDGETGILCPAGDVAAMGAAVAGLLEDPRRAALMGVKGRARVAERFTLGGMAERVEKLYEVLAEESVGGRRDD